MLQAGMTRLKEEAQQEDQHPKRTSNVYLLHLVFF